MIDHDIDRDGFIEHVFSCPRCHREVHYPCPKSMGIILTLGEPDEPPEFRLDNLRVQLASAQQTTQTLVAVALNLVSAVETLRPNSPDIQTLRNLILELRDSPTSRPRT